MVAGALVAEPVGVAGIPVAGQATGGALPPAALEVALQGQADHLGGLAGHPAGQGHVPGAGRRTGAQGQGHDGTDAQQSLHGRNFLIFVVWGKPYDRRNTTPLLDNDSLLAV
ncbi:hypothetical protein D3C78_1588040 [compost metagenome]